MKLKFLIYVFIMFLTSSCSEQDNVVKQNSTDSLSTERIFIDLEYLGKMNNVKYMMTNTPLAIGPEIEFTWWNHYTVQDYLECAPVYDYVLSNEVDGKNHDIIISFGRKLQYLYYYEKDFTYDEEHDGEGRGYRARPIFEEEFLKGSAYLYLINKTELANSELASNDLQSFVAGYIPFELLVED